jgi:diguanylate cyclase (GGDEF)-like protein/PAS domain S-box-containing protein
MGLETSVTVWITYEHLWRVALLTFAVLAILFIVRRRVGGRGLSYHILVGGLILLLVGELLRLDVPLVPAWTVGDATIYLPAYGGGYLLVLAGFLSVMHDARRARDAICGERDFIQGIIETSEVFIMGLSLDDGRILMFNKGGERITGYSRQEVVGRLYREVFLAPEDRAEAIRIREAIRTGGLQEIGDHEHRIITKSGESRLISWTYTVCHDHAGRQVQVVAFGHDVTEQRQMQDRLEKAKTALEEANKELHRLASTDYLTGLTNRRLAMTLLDREIVRARRHRAPLSVILMDLDGFKAINDTYGHEAGDEVLKHVAQLLSRRLRATDIVARHGGDEFLLLFPETGPAEAPLLADIVQGLIRENPFTWHGAQIPLAASLGLAACDIGRNLTPDELVRRADEAMYRAKRAGGNRVETWNCPAPAETPSCTST